MTAKRFRVALSFPGEHRAYVSKVAAILREKLGQDADAVFYDQWYTAELARPNMDTYLQAIYHKDAALIVPFLCADYEHKLWCGLEWRAIRALFDKRMDDIMPLRFDDTEIPGLFKFDGYIDLRTHTPEQIAAFILQRLNINNNGISGRSDFSPTTTPSTTPRIHSDRLPTVKGGFFGRIAELRMLNDAWAGNDTHIIQFIAPGGTGKTKLLRHWLDHTDGIDALLAWSFYSQGASEDKQVSATPFFSHVFEKLGSTRETFATEEDKGEHLADLLRQQRCVLVLDGLEPLQHAGRGMQGELKDRAIRQLLKSLASHCNGLCIVTTRIAVHELCDRTHVIRRNLKNLAPEDGVLLLQSLGVHGSAAELQKAVQEYGCHALALSLLGNVLRLRYQGDVLKRDTLKALPLKAKGSKESRHAFKVMQAYEEWFAGEPELALLHLLGLFDHPIDPKVLNVLLDARIPNLTAPPLTFWSRLLRRKKPLSKEEKQHWQTALDALREEHHLLAQHEGGNDLDCHPLIREYFGQQLQHQQPNAWQQAHETLYGYYQALPEQELPDTLAEMQPLFSAVAHGCAAGLHQQALDEVYWPRLSRKNEFFSTAKLGAFSDNLATVAHFFTTPWHTPAAGLQEMWQAGVLNWAGFGLRALGRLREALEPMQAAVDLFAKQENWKEAAANASNLSELQLTLGEVAQAKVSSQRSVGYADQSGDMFQRMSKRTAHADALHQAGETAAALALFREAEQLQQEWQPAFPRLYSLQGFRYCDLLLAQGRTAEVLERAEQTLEWVTTQNWLLDIALDQLSLGRAHLQQAVEETPPNLPLSGEAQERTSRSLSAAEGWLEQAVAGLRAAGQQDDLPRGLLARAALHRHTRDFARARQDLLEVFEIAEPSGMRLFLVDWHLEMARVLVAEAGFDFAQPSDLAPNHSFDYAQPTSGTPRCLSVVDGNRKQAQTHIKAAANLIAATGYHRRDPELAELQGLTR